ncbi:MAG: bifunctional hydroxymethylpyrimidine kinase/phosphomethylpyrimidine kinase [Bryobacterales bacterium]|nr:bifunctional hydroxymethylpyrimidine kinase/phosphomethylpyrimidine kinase [Bryobacterales bacterium]
MPVALTIAGSDPSGGAGLQADLKTFHRFGVYGEAIPTLITVQNSLRLTRVEHLAADLVEAQIQAVLEDMPPNAAKTGALGSRSVVEAVASRARGFSFPLVVDPVLSGTLGGLLGEGAFDALIAHLLPRAFLLTPNLREASAITGLAVQDRDSMLAAGKTILALGAKNVLVKGGHLAGNALDLLVTGAGAIHEFNTERIETPHTHGSGCTYSAAITAELAKGVPLADAILSAKRFVTEAIASNPGLGSGHGPLNHFA